MRKFLICAIVSLNSASALAQNFLWQTGAASAHGNGCNSTTGDVAFLENGEDLSIVFQSMGIDLPANGSAQLSEQKDCNITMPFSLAASFRPSQITEAISYGIVKSAGASAQISYESRIQGVAVSSPLGISFQQANNRNSPGLTASRNLALDMGAGPMRSHCLYNKGSQMAYTGHLAILGKRSSASQDLIVSTDALDIRLEVSAQGMKGCERPPVVVPPPRPTQPPPAAACAGGYFYQGVCERLGSFGASCNQVCANHGGVSATHPELGSNVTCGHVIRNLDFSVPRQVDNSFVYPCAGGNASSFGCFVFTDNNAEMCRNAFFSPGSADPRVKPVCACAH